jgi:hypothetical protein
MSRVEQPPGARGSLKWIQRAVNMRPRLLDEPLLAKLPKANAIEWLSPLASDKYAEYRDGDFLDRIGASELRPQLAAFWPQRDPQWDALARTDRGDILLVEAKAHIAEMLSPATQAGPQSLASIKASLDHVANALGVKAKSPWTDTFYQLANRLAHLWFLRQGGKPAWLVLANFVGDADVHGPQSPREWEAAYLIAGHVMGLPKQHALARWVLHIYPSVSDLA